VVKAERRKKHHFQNQLMSSTIVVDTHEIYDDDWELEIYGVNWDFFQNFEELPLSRLRLPIYLSWLENHWHLYRDIDFEQVRIALSNNWYLAEVGFGIDGIDDNDDISYLVAVDPRTEPGHRWVRFGIPSIQDHQNSINDLQEGRFPPECLCNMCQFGRGIPTESMQRFLNSHQVAIETLRLSMPGK
jgi:hypothetical protein